jgi:hypothetical protein
MSYGPNIHRSVDVPFFQFPLGINLKERWISDNESEIYVHKILSHNDSTKYIKPGYVLKRINEKRLNNDSLHDIQSYLVDQKSTTGTKTPLLCTFGIVDFEGSGTPLFDPFSNNNDANCDTCDDQKTQFYEHTKMKMPMSTLPGGGSGSGAGSCSTGGKDVILSSGGGESHWVNDNDVINVNDLKKHMINIDSDFRTNPVNPTSNFYVDLNPKINNAIRIRLASAEIPNTYYEFTAKKQNTFLRFISPVHGTDYTFTIPDGNYCFDVLESILTQQFAGKIPLYTIDIDTINAKTTFSTDDNSEFTMEFRTLKNSPFEIGGVVGPEPANNWGLAYYLGFRQKYYAGFKSYRSEAIINIDGDQYIFLKINDYHTVNQPFPDGNILQAFTKIILRNDKFTETFNDSSDLLTREYIFTQPTNITRIQVQLVNKYDEVLDFLDAPVSIALEITEVMNCKLYDFYRNYMFQKKLKY